MPQPERPGKQSGPLIDLASVSAPQRAQLWSAAARNAFPSLDITHPGPHPEIGSIQQVSLGEADFYSIESAPVEVRHRAEGGRAANPGLSLVMQNRGAMTVSQAGQAAHLRSGDLCLVDEARGFRLAAEGECGILFVRLPRIAVFARNPALQRMLANTLPGDEPGAAILADTLRRVARDSGLLREGQRSALAATFVSMLGLLQGLAGQDMAPDWRVREALDFIELNLPVAGLTADMVAQELNISRRRLDQLMQQALGCSVAAHLWSRRLEQAAADLRDGSRSRLSIAQIAFANGFEDPAHFTRAFKRRYAVTPGQWRLS